MSWERYEERKQHGSERFVATLHVTKARRGPDHQLGKNGSSGRGMAYLGFNNAVREQILHRCGWVDVFIDRLGRRLGLRFVAQPTDLHSYKIAMRNGAHTEARICAVGFLKKWGLYEPLRGRRLVAEMKHDPAQAMYWFSVAGLMDPVAAISYRHPALPVFQNRSQEVKDAKDLSKM